MPARKYKHSADYDDPLLAEPYDKHETGTGDLALIRALLNGATHLSIFEGFTGAGRLLIPLLVDGHAAAGVDIAYSMIERARVKAKRLGNSGLSNRV